MEHFDYVVVGAGLYGAVFAYQAKQAGKTVLVLDRRKNIAGNIYTQLEEGINVHKYGAHIFHTSNPDIWNFINRFAKFNRFTNCPKAFYKGKLYSLPFNMNTFYELWGEKDPSKVKQIIAKQIAMENIGEPKNLEEQALKLVGRDVYTTLVKGYTEKQWGQKATELPSFIIKRLPIRYTFDNNYFNDLYQGIPIGGYTNIISQLLNGIEVKLGVDFLKAKDKYMSMADKVIFTGCIDEYYQYCYGELGYRSLRFEESTIDSFNYQGNAVINYTEYEVPYTRIIEHKHFENAVSDKTVITKEYPANWIKGDEPYYPVNNDENNRLYSKYFELSKKEQKVAFGGRLGLYKYFDMDKVIKAALDYSKQEFGFAY